MKNYMVRIILGNNKYGRHYFDTFVDAKQFFNNCACAILYSYNNHDRVYDVVAKH